MAIKKQQKLRVWHIPQVPGKPFYVPVKTPEEGAKIIDILSIYDQFQFQNRIKPDFSNACGLEVWDDDLDPDKNGEKWTDWCDLEGDDLNAYMEKHTKKKGKDYVQTLIEINNIDFKVEV